MVRMFSRADTGTFVGAGMTGGGLSVEVVKHSRPISQDIMKIDWLFFTDNYHLNTGGAIALVGVILLLHSSYRGYKEKKKREARHK